MSSKPIDDLSFWSRRLNEASNGGDLRDSVFISTEWEIIDELHKKILNTFISEEDKVLDAGCGYGRASTFIPGIYTGVDHSHDFIEKANSLYPNKDFIVSNINELPFDDNSFDWSVCISVHVMIISNKGYSAWDKTQTELLRVTKKGILCLEYGDQNPRKYASTYTMIGKV